MNLESFELVLLRRPAGARGYDEATIARIQREHLAYYASLRASGAVATNGPVVDGPDQSLRGLAFYRTGSLERAQALAQADPAVRAGRLEATAMTWWCTPGTLTKAGSPLTVPDA
jgi:hypothetical protein